MTEVGDIPPDAVEAAFEAAATAWHMANGGSDAGIAKFIADLRAADAGDENLLHGIASYALTAAYPSLLAHLDKSAADNKVLVAEVEERKEWSRLQAADIMTLGAEVGRLTVAHKVLVAENERLRELQKLVVAYDDLLLCFKGPSIIFDGDVKEIDEAFDRMVAIARALTETKKP